MPRSRRYDPALERQRVAEFHATLPWRPFVQSELPDNVPLVVRLKDRSAMGARWNATKGNWDYGPSPEQGQPVEWAPLPPLHKSP